MRLSRLGPLLAASHSAPPGGGSTLFEVALNLDYASGLSSGHPVAILPAMFSESHSLFANAQADGGDIRAYLGEGQTTPIPLELYHWDAGEEEIIAYVRPSAGLSQNDKIYLTCGSADGSPLSQPAADAEYGRNNVWQDFEFVLHDSGTFDSAGNLTTSKTGTLAAAGPNGLKALGYDNHGAGGTDRVSTGFTADSQTRSFAVLLFQDTAGASNASFHRVWSKSANDEALISSNVFEIKENYSDGAKIWGATASATIWRDFGVSHDASGTAKPTIYRDGGGRAFVTDATVTGAWSSVADEMLIGNLAASNRAWAGRMSEFWWSHSVLPATFFAARNANLSSPGTFASANAGAFL